MSITQTRAELVIDGRRLSYVDFGGHGRPLLALHGHLSEGASFAALAAEPAPDWRVIAPDQRGHGESDRAADYSRDGYIADAVAARTPVSSSWRPTTSSTRTTPPDSPRRSAGSSTPWSPERGRQPLTAPMTTPLVKCFCTNG